MNIPKEINQRLLISVKELEKLTGWDSYRQYKMRKANKDMPFIKIGSTIEYRVPDIFSWIDKHLNPNYKQIKEFKTNRCCAFLRRALLTNTKHKRKVKNESSKLRHISIKRGRQTLKPRAAKYRRVKL